MHAATLSKGSPGVLHGSLSYLIQDADGQVIDPHSISAGLDYPGVGPEHAFLKEMQRAEYVAVTDEDALEAFQEVSLLRLLCPFQLLLARHRWHVTCRAMQTAF